MKIYPAQSMHFKVTLDGSGKEDCSTLTLPSSLYVDWDEISRLDRATEIVELVEGDTDVEIPQVASNEDTILRLHLYGQSITLPVHARYPLLKQRAGVSESTLVSTFHSCMGTPSTQSTQDTSTVYIPTGSSNHRFVVAATTTAITLAGFVYILSCLFRRGHAKNE